MRPFTLLDYFFLMRPILFFPGWTTTLAGYLAATGYPSPVNNQFPSKTFLFSLLASTCLMGAGFIANQIQDLDTDRINKKLFLLADGFIPVRHAFVQTLVLSALCLLMSFQSTPTMAIIQALGLFWIIIVYNFKPFSFKNRPVESFIANTTMGIFAFAYGWFSISDDFEKFVLQGLPYFIFNGALCLLTTVPDAAGDKLTAKRTLSVVYGSVFVMRFALFLQVLAFGFAILNRDVFVISLILLTLPFFVFMGWRLTPSSGVIAVKFSIFLFSCFVAAYFWWYMIVMAILFFITRRYYKKRFNFNYPTFQG